MSYDAMADASNYGHDAGSWATGPPERLTLTRDEFAAFLNESFDNGARAAFLVLGKVIGELDAKVETLRAPGSADV